MRIRVPAKADYFVLARLALSAICRLSPLEHSDVADLKLAITEAATAFVAAPGDDDAQIEFLFRLGDDRLEMELRGEPSDVPDSEQELSQAIVEATVDEVDLTPERVLLVKRLAA